MSSAAGGAGPSASSIDRVEALIRELGIEARITRAADHVWTLVRGATTVQVVVAQEFVVVTAKVLDRSPQVGGEAFYRRLLEANVKLLGAFFTLEADGSIRINQVLPVDWLQSSEFAFILGNVAGKSAEWADRLTALAG